MTAPQLAARSPHAATANAYQWARLQARSPARLFVWLSLLFGVPLMVITPPFRGPDEPAHFLRAYGISRGELMPRERVEGRVGIRLPPALHAEYSFFEDARNSFAAKETRYAEVLAAYWAREAARAAAVGNDDVFVPYQGSEAYSPAAYLPQALAALVARIAKADFLVVFYLMRMAGFLAMTAVAAYAIAIAPGLNWAFLLIGLLPSALFGRATISADGATLAFAMLATALALRAGTRAAPIDQVRQRVLWMTLCILSKPSQVALAMVELLALSPARLRRHWWVPAAVALPGLILAVLWVLATGGEMAAWRVIESTGETPEQFDIGWKLAFAAQHPGHFFAALGTSLWLHAGSLYVQLIGVLGWLDTWLQPWVYPLLGVLLVMAAMDRLAAAPGQRPWILGAAAATVGVYVVLVYFLLYVSWTPVTADQIWGVQGRYFLPVLPAAGIAITAALDRQGVAAPAAMAGAMLAGIATIEAVWRTNW